MPHNVDSHLKCSSSLCIVCGNRSLKSLKHFPMKTFPITTFLEAHCTDWIRLYGLGLGCHGEQGGEFVHSTVNSTERRAAGFKNEMSQLKFIMDTHLVQVPLV